MTGASSAELRSKVKVVCRDITETVAIPRQPVNLKSDFSAIFPCKARDRRSGVDGLGRNHLRNHDDLDFAWSTASTWPIMCCRPHAGNVTGTKLKTAWSPRSALVPFHLAPCWLQVCQPLDGHGPPSRYLRGSTHDHYCVRLAARSLLLYFALP